MESSALLHSGDVGETLENSNDVPTPIPSYPLLQRTYSGVKPVFHSSLPFQVVLRIFSFLSFQELCAVAAVNSSLRLLSGYVFPRFNVTICRDEDLWRQKYEEFWTTHRQRHRDGRVNWKRVFKDRYRKEQHVIDIER